MSNDNQKNPALESEEQPKTQNEEVEQQDLSVDELEDRIAPVSVVSFE